MGRTMRRWASLALAAALVLGTGAVAAEPVKTQAEQRQKDLTALYETLAVLLTRTATALGLTPKAMRTTPLPAALAANAWDTEALESAWSWGLLPETASSATVPTRTQGEGAVTSLFKNS